MIDSLVIGAGGFVGSYLLRQLMEEGHWPGATKLPHESLAIDGVEVYDLDLGDQAAVRRLLEAERPAQIYHLAAQSSVAVSWKKPELTVDVNIKGTLHLLEAIRSIEDYFPRILLVCSGEEYGYLREGACPIAETEPLRPGNLYAVTKACQNMIGSVYARAYGMGIVMVPVSSSWILVPLLGAGVASHCSGVGRGGIITSGGSLRFFSGFLSQKL